MFSGIDFTQIFLRLFIVFGVPEPRIIWKTKSLERFRLYRTNTKKSVIQASIFVSCWILLAYFGHAFSGSFFGYLLGCLFSDFWVKMAAQKV